MLYWILHSVTPARTEYIDLDSASRSPRSGYPASGLTFMVVILDLDIQVMGSPKGQCTQFLHGSLSAVSDIICTTFLGVESKNDCK